MNTGSGREVARKTLLNISIYLGLSAVASIPRRGSLYDAEFLEATEVLCVKAAEISDRRRLLPALESAVGSPCGTFWLSGLASRHLRKESCRGQVCDLTSKPLA